MQAMTKYERAELVIKAAVAFLPKDATVQMCSTDIVIHNSEVIFAFMIQVHRQPLSLSLSSSSLFAYLN